MTETHHHAQRGYLLAATAALLWGTSGVIARYLFRSQALHPFDLLSIRTQIAAVLYVIWLAATAPKLLRVARTDLKHLAIFGIIGLAFNQGCYYLALNLTSVGYALLLQYTMPVMLMTYGLITRTEHITRGKAVAAGMTLAGAALMMGGQAGGFANVSLAGTLFALGSALGYCFYSVAGKSLLARYDSRTVITYGFIASSLTWIVVHPFWTVNWQSFNRQAWGLTMFIAITGTVLPFVIYLACLRYIEASRAGVTATLEPVFAASLAWVLLGERMLPLQLLGGFAVLCGVVLLQVEERRTSAKNNPFETLARED